MRKFECDFKEWMHKNPISIEMDVLPPPNVDPEKPSDSEPESPENPVHTETEIKPQQAIAAEPDKSPTTASTTETRSPAHKFVDKWK
jgi:hypothetical protein